MDDVMEAYDWLCACRRDLSIFWSSCRVSPPGTLLGGEDDERKRMCPSIKSSSSIRAGTLETVDGAAGAPVSVGGCTGATCTDAGNVGGVASAVLGGG